MKISTRGRYGLRIMLELALRHGADPVMADVIAANQHISANYIHVLIRELRTAGLVVATRGPNGGYNLARSPQMISVLEITSALEGRTEIVDCVVRRQNCSMPGFCAANTVWQRVNQAIEDTLKNITLEQLVLTQRERHDEPADFQI